MTALFVRFGSALAALALASAAQAARPGELWESSTQMNMPGLPAGMGAQKVTLCKDPKEAVAQDPKRQQCQILDQKQSGSRVTVRMRCPDGEMTMDFTYNAARTEYTGTMQMKSRNGDMTMNMSGRKLGACDLDNPQDTRAQAQAKGEQMKREIAASQKQTEEETIQRCDAALDQMQYGNFQGASPETCKPGSQTGQGLARAYGKGFPRCCADVGEYCKRYQTQAGFTKARGDRKAAEFCALSYDTVKAPLCSNAAKAKSYDFLLSYCPAEGKVLAEKDCAGRDFTSMEGTFGNFCRRYLARRDFDENESSGGKPGRAARPAAQKAAEPQPPSAPAPAAPAANPAEAVNQGINKLKGLFGR